MPTILNGKALADTLKHDLTARVQAIKARGGQARLDAILVGSSDNAARVYATNQGKTCASVGIEYRLHELGTSGPITFDDLAGRVLFMNTREDISAIMLHMPLPASIDPYEIQKLIAPEKDVEGVNPANIGNIVYGRSSLAPCTGLAVISMLKSTKVPLQGKRALVIGASDVVGKPIAVLLMRQDCTVISCNKFSGHDYVTHLAKSADIIIAAAGVPKLVTKDMVRPGQIIIDVGVNRITAPDGHMITVGDVDFLPVTDVLGPDGWISPVPGGVGPMTVAMLLNNVVQAAERAVGIDSAP
jgi:methylenetetrahydrofolate dehydrogenase (NADP+) / methenyltetrahydrofolate cyclohydrolase